MRLVSYLLSVFILFTDNDRRIDIDSVHVLCIFDLLNTVGHVYDGDASDGSHDRCSALGQTPRIISLSFGPFRL